MITEVVLPQMGLEVAEGVVLALPIAVGQTVAEGDVIAEVETDKAIAEVPASRAGVIVAIEVALEETIPIGTVIVRIADSADEVVSASATPATEPADAEPAADATAAGGPVTVAAAPVATTSNGASAEPADGARRLRAAPIARRAAAAHGIDLQLVTGTGPSGRITLGDVERAVAERDESPAEPQTPVVGTPNASGGGRLEPLSATRQSIARRLTESQLVPQYTLTREIDAGWLLAEKSRLTAAGPVKVGVLDLLLVGLAETISRHRQLAASFVPGRDGEPPAYRHPEAIDLGVAVATDRGLLVPVIRGAESRTVSELVLERSRLIDLTRAGRLGPADMGGAAATLSSLGTFGVDQFTAMLNPGESAILAAGRAVERLVPRERGIAVAPMISLTFTFDHRVVDGAVGGAALSELADLLEGSMEWPT
ncbi:MAG TPA: dihydrolipoamide acetyltransferase family protein [Solirubrobacterales bacterium]|nr:dihydrolipoamide acetyltransferase family protein [Solirubrobacterales bacterium]